MNQVFRARVERFIQLCEASIDQPASATSEIPEEVSETANSIVASLMGAGYSPTEVAIAIAQGSLLSLAELTDDLGP